MGTLTKSAPERRFLYFPLVLLTALLLTACGGGGGGSGSAVTGQSGTAGGIELISITFPEYVGMTGNLKSPPEQPTPLSQQIVFTFSGPVEGPVTTSSILINAPATSAYEGPQVLLDPQKNLINALGKMETYSNVVVFTPEIPLKDINLAFNALPGEIPGLLPDTTYQVYVPIGTSGSIANLKAVHPGVQNPLFFTTTSTPNFYFHNFSIDHPPVVTDTQPKNGRVDFPINTLSVISGQEPCEGLSLSFDQPLHPDAKNIKGKDSDGDGFIEPNLFLRFSDPLLFAATDLYRGIFRLDWQHPENDALDTFKPVKHNGTSVALCDVAMNHAGRMVGLSEGVLYSVDYRTETPPVELGALYDSELAELKGLAWSHTGLFYSVNRATGQLVTLDADKKDTTVVDTLVKGATVQDLVFRHNGELYLLRVEGSTSFVERIDPTTGDLLAVVSNLKGEFVSLDFLDRKTLCLFEEKSRNVWTLDLESSVPSDRGPITQLAEGKVDLCTLFYEWETDGYLVENTYSNAVVSIDPKGMMPFGREMEIMVRHRLMNMGLDSLAADTDLSMQCVATFTTFDPGPAAKDDRFVELFETNDFEGNAQELGSARAVWNYRDTAHQPPKYQHLLATFGLGGSGELGDFLPLGIFPVIILDTDYQPLPLYDGSTPNVTAPIVVDDGWFNFRDIVIPWGVTIYARGSNPLVLTATGDVTIQGTIDVSGEPGQHDFAFDSGFIPNAGGLGGCGGGRGGMSQPPMPPNFQSLPQLITARTGEHGWGPSDGAQIGGQGGESTARPEVPYKGASQDLKSRGAGGGGGTFLQTGTHGQRGKGTHVPDNLGGAIPKEGEGGVPGAAMFVDPDPDNNFFGPDGEHKEVFGGQGGGGAGCRWDSLNPNCYKQTPPGWPQCMWDAKGGGAGGGGGAVAIHALGTITVAETGRLLSHGGMAGRGEQTGAANFGGGGGGGSGGAIILEAGEKIILEESSDPDPEAKGAWLEVTGGDMGDGRETTAIVGQSPALTCPFGDKPSPQYCSLSRGDGGQGGFGIIQLMVDDPDNNLIPPPADIATAKVFVGAYYFDADPDTGEYDYTPKGFPYYERWYLTYEDDPEAYPKYFVWGKPGEEPLPDVTMYVVPEPPLVSPYKTVSYLSAVSYGLSQWIDLGSAIHRPEVDMGGGMMVKAPAFFGFEGTDPVTGLVNLQNGYVKNFNVPELNDIELMAPDLGLHHFIPPDNEVGVEFQGAHAAVPGLSTPGDEMTEWTADLTKLSGYQFIRYRVRLNVATSGELNLGNTRPQVDKIRLRAKY
jgi:hypothetical protein